MTQQSDDAAELIVVSGPPAAGKTTVARLLAARLQPRACVVESDFWWTTVVNGFIPPWQPAAHDQNRIIIRSFSRAAAALAQGGYHVVLEGIVGPWNLDLVMAEAAAVDVAVRYVVLRPSLDTVLGRAAGRAGEERVPGHPALTDEEPVRKMWHEFSDLGPYESHVIDNSHENPSQTLDVLWPLLQTDRLRV